MRTLTILLLSALAQAANAQTTETDFRQRNVLLEVFSTERCNNCPSAHQAIADVLGSAPHLIEVTHHAGFLTDPFTIPESVEYEWFYKSPQYSGTFAPAFMTDRTAWTDLDDYYYYGTPVAMTFSTKPLKAALKAAYAEAVQVPALADISITPQYDPATRELNIDIEAEALADDDACSHPALNVFLVEDNVLAVHQEGVYGQYLHPHLVRQCLTTTWGEAFEPGGTIARSYTVTLPADWEAEEVSIVAFVANYNPSRNSDCRVMNAEEASLRPFLDGIATIETTAPRASQRPTFNILGRRCNPSHLPHGIYLAPDADTTKLIVQ